MSGRLERAASATVRLPGLGGQGVVVPGQLILTAAHCVQWEVTGGMVLGDYYVEEVESGDRRVLAQVYAVEPVADVAVLGTLDGQCAPDPADAFEAWCEPVKPVPLCTSDFPMHEPFPVWIRAHTGRWIKAQAEQFVPQSAGLVIRADEGIEGGTSGGPVATEDGLLLGVVSNSAGVSGGPYTKMLLSRLHLALPGRLLRTMLDPGWEARAWSKHRKREKPSRRFRVRRKGR